MRNHQYNSRMCATQHSVSLAPSPRVVVVGKGTETHVPEKRVLVVEDDSDVRGFVTMVLAEEGYVVAEAENGVEALTEVRKERPSLILLDMRLPVMDGWEFSRRLHDEFGRSIPVVVMTALHDPAVVARQVEARAVLRKPFDIAQLLTMVQKNAA